MRTLTAAAALMLPAAAFAGGYALPSVNPRDLGMAESAVAAQEGPAAVYGNSAALAGQEGLGISAAGLLLYFRSDFTPAVGGPSTSTVPKATFPPALYVAYGDKVNGMPYGVGAGFTVIGGGFVFWPDDWVGKTYITQVDRRVYNFIVSGGLQPIPELKVGLGLVYFRTTERLKQGLDFSPNGAAELAAAGGKLSWTASLEAGPLRDVPLALGFTYRHQAVQTLNGQAHFGNIPDTLRSAGLYDQDAVHVLAFPNVVQVGAAYRLLPDVLLTAAFQLGRFTVYQQDVFAGPGTTVRVAREYHNQKVYRLGAELSALPNLKVRGGVLRDVSPQPTDTLNPSLPDSSSYAFNLGATYDLLPALALSAGWEHAFFDTATTTGNQTLLGTYKTQADLVSLGLTYRMQ